MASGGRGSFRKSEGTFVGDAVALGAMPEAVRNGVKDRAQQVADIATVSAEGACRTAKNILLKKNCRNFFNAKLFSKYNLKKFFADFLDAIYYI